VIALWIAAGAPAWGGSWDALFDHKLTPPDATYPGAFDAAPVLHFRVPLPGPPLNAATHAERSDPLISGEVVFVGSAAANALYALSRRDGAVVQAYPARNSVEAQPAVADGRVYFSDTGGNTYCYTVEGERQWAHDGTAPVLVAPALTPDGTRVIVTNVDDLAVALDATTGTLAWQYRGRRDLTRQAELSLYAAPRATVLEDQVVLGFSSGTLAGVDLDTGEELWQRAIGEGRYPDLVADPVAIGTDLLTSGYFRPLVALDLATRNPRWRVEAGAAHPVAVDERDAAAVIYHPGTDGKLRAIAALTGASLWTWDSGSSGALTTPRITEAGLLVASSDGALYLVDAASGTQVWEWHESWLLNGVSSVPAVSGRQLLFLSNGGVLYSMLVPQGQGI